MLYKKDKKGEPLLPPAFQPADWFSILQAINKARKWEWPYDRYEVRFYGSLTRYVAFSITSYVLFTTYQIIRAATEISPFDKAFGTFFSINALSIVIAASIYGYSALRGNNYLRHIYYENRGKELKADHLGTTLFRLPEFILIIAESSMLGATYSAFQTFFIYSEGLFSSSLEIAAIFGATAAITMGIIESFIATPRVESCGLPSFLRIPVYAGIGALSCVAGQAFAQSLIDTGINLGTGGNAFSTIYGMCVASVAMVAFCFVKAVSNAMYEDYITLTIEKDLAKQSLYVKQLYSKEFS